MKMLYLNNMHDFQWPMKLNLFFQDQGFEVDVFWANQNQFPDDLDNYECLFLSGSINSPNDDIEWIHHEIALIQTAAQRNFPILGICFGSQVLAAALCGKQAVFRRNSCEIGYIDIHLNLANKEDPLLRGLKNNIKMFVWHNDEVISIHKDIVILGSSYDCPNHIWGFQDKPIWGIQGHPELSKDQVIETFHIYKDLFEKDGVNINEQIKLIGDNKDAQMLITNFSKYCRLKLS